MSLKVQHMPEPDVGQPMAPKTAEKTCSWFLIFAKSTSLVTRVVNLIYISRMSKSLNEDNFILKNSIP